VISALGALIVGLALGWFLGSRPLADARQQREEAEAETKALDEKFRAAIRDLAAASERATRTDELAQKVDALRTEREAMHAELVTFKANAANHDKQMAQLLEAKEALSAQFSEVGSRLLDNYQARFLEQAGKRFEQSEEKHETTIKALLQPVESTLKLYQEQVEKVEKHRNEAYGDIKGLMDQMRMGQQQVRDETAKLVSSLRHAPKARGRWGEQQLKNVLETCGLSEHTDFILEHSVNTDDGRLRPDAVVRIPGGKSLIIDAKVSFNDYQAAFEAEDESTKQASLAAHCNSM